MADQAFPIVGVGASAGGIEAFTDLLKNLPEAPGIAIVFVLHQDPKHQSLLAPVVARSSRMPVEFIRDGTPIEIDRVYVIPPDAELTIADGMLRLGKRTSGTSLIDTFLSSLARDQGSRAISVVLSGSASDGALGTKEVKVEGGITFAQDNSARMESMPHAAVAAGFVDFVLPPHAIAEELLRVARHDYVGLKPALFPERDLKKLFTVIRTKHDIDFANYKMPTIERRIRRRMALRRTDTLDKYLDIVRKDPQEIQDLYGEILIKVTGFFRDPDVFKVLEHDLLPKILRERSADNSTARVWVPGCATGEEVYSLAISMLDSIGAFSCPTQFFGTDVSEAAIDRARDGLYPASIAADVPEQKLKRFFSKVESGYRIAKSVRDFCIFARQDVTKDPPFSKLDLISCRNVMIYFGTVLQRKVMSIFNYALRSDGYLLLGTAETIGGFDEFFAMSDRKNKIYQKKTAVHRPIHFQMPQPPKKAEHHDLEVVQAALPANAVFRDADRVLLSRFSPVGVVINENLEVLQFRGRTSRYLESPPGAATFNLLKLARSGLLSDLRTAIFAARKKDAPQRREGIRVKTDGRSIVVNLEVIPFVAASKERFLLVLFDEPAPQKKGRGAAKAKPEPSGSKETERLKRELDATREYLQSVIEDQEAMNEELRSANEEIQSSNEELQSTNEELETAKEELQSTNEELTTLNEELENRNQELTQLNNDLNNLLSSVEIPIIILDSSLRIRRVNPIAQRKFSLSNSDIGRPITDINTKLPLEGLDRMVAEVLDRLEVREVEIKDKAGRVQSLRIRPYRTMDNKIDGAVLVLIDVEEFRRKGAGMQPN